MKRLVALVLILALAVPAFAGRSPSPKYLKIATVANDDVVFLGIRGKQTNVEYGTTYVTLQASANLNVQFDSDAELTGYYTGTESGTWGGASYDYYLGNKVLCPAGVKITLKVTAKKLLITDVGGSPGSLEIWAEYE